MEVGDRVIINTNGWDKLVGFIVSVPRPEDAVSAHGITPANNCYGVRLSNSVVMSIRPEYLVIV